MAGLTDLINRLRAETGWAEIQKSNAYCILNWPLELKDLTCLTGLIPKT